MRIMINLLATPVLCVALFGCGGPSPIVAFGVCAIEWHPSGAQIAVAVRSSDSARMSLINIGDRAEQVVYEEDGVVPIDPAFSVDGTSLVFGIGGKARGIVVLDLEPRRVTTFPTGYHVCGHPQESPAGDAIVYSAGRSGGQNDLWFLDLRTRQHRQLTFTTEHEVSPFWLPDGNHIVYWRAAWFGHSSPIASCAWHDFSPYRMSVSDATSRPVCECCDYSFEGASQTLNRDQLLYSGTYCHGNNIHIVDVSRNTCVTPEPKGVFRSFTVRDPAPEEGDRSVDLTFQKDMYFPHIAGNGERVAFAMATVPSRMRDAPKDLFLMELDTLDTTQLTHWSWDIVLPRVSPDGRRIAFAASEDYYQEDGPFALWLVDGDGSNLRRINVSLHPKQER